jgi:hypothetical protein
MSGCAARRKAGPQSSSGRWYQPLTEERLADPHSAGARRENSPRALVPSLPYPRASWLTVSYSHRGWGAHDSGEHRLGPYKPFPRGGLGEVSAVPSWRMRARPQVPEAKSVLTYRSRRWSRGILKPARCFSVQPSFLRYSVPTSLYFCSCYHCRSTQDTV